MKKKIISLLLCAVMIITFIPAEVFASSRTFSFEKDLAEDLKALGLFKGVSDTDFALDRAPTRTEALVMLIRVLGKESEALSQGGKHPFLDVPEWADKYVGYAYQRNLTNGISATKFGGNAKASSSMYLTFVLRALGYSDTNGADFTWDNPFTLARTTGIMIGNPDTINFLRADVVLISYAALEAEVKGTKQTLAQKLISAEAISAAAYDKYYDVSAFANFGEDPTRDLSASEVYKKCSPAVFLIAVYDKFGDMFAHGSGFFIDSNGTAVTNFHVIEGAYSAKILTPDDRQYNVLGIYDYNPARDWAVIKVDGKNFPYLETDESPISGGEVIYTIGSPQGLDNTISEGLISNVNRNIDGIPFIQISAPTSQGSSGGALINKLGKVIGITSAGWAGGENLNLAIPIKLIKGYKSTTVHPFTAIIPSGSDKILGNIDLDMYPEDERAFELLRMWVYNCQNDSAEWGPAYVEQSYYDDGTLEEWFLGYDEDNKRFVIGIGQYSDEISASYVLDFTQWEKTTLRFSFKSKDEYGDEIYDWGVAYPYKEEYEAGMEVWFSDYGGDYLYKTMWEEETAEMLPYMLSFVETVLTRELSGYEIDGIRALGFKNYYFD